MHAVKKALLWFGVLIAIPTIVSFFDAKEAAHLVFKGEKTIGIVDTVYSINAEGFDFYVSIGTFRIQDKVYEFRNHYQNSDKIYSKNQKVLILYDKKDPNSNVIGSNIEKITPFLGLGLLLALATGCLILSFFLKN